MRVEKFEVDKEIKLSSFLAMRLSNVSLSVIKSAMKNKDIKVDGVRIKTDMILTAGQVVEIYLQDKYFEIDIEILYQDENIIVVNKPQGVETVNEFGSGLKEFIEKKINLKVFAVHRLDRNTGGLVVFAKNNQAKNELDYAFKNRTIDKFYLALVYGMPLLEKAELVAYLKKDDKQSRVYVLNDKQTGYEKIQTNYRVVQKYDDVSLLEVKLVTGKTHQIRAHLAHIGNFVIGDEKYGDSKINKIFKKKKQCLWAYKIQFNLKDGLLKYLDGKIIELDTEKIDFVKNCKNL